MYSQYAIMGLCGLILGWMVFAKQLQVCERMNNPRLVGQEKGSVALA